MLPDLTVILPVLSLLQYFPTVSQIPPSIAITSVLSTLEPKDSLIMGDKDLSTIPKKELNEFIKSSVEDLVPIPSESGDTSKSDSDCDLPSYDDYSSIDVPRGNSVTFSNPLFDSNEDFTSSDDESLSDEDVPEDNDIENKESYEPAFDSIPPGIDGADFDPEGDILLLKKLLNDDISFPLPPKELHFEGLNIPPDSEEFFDHDPKNLKDEPDNKELKSMVKVFDPGIHEKSFSPTYVKIPFEDHHYLSLTYVIQNFLPYFTYPVDSSLLLSSGSEDTIFDPDISVFSLEPVVSHQSGTFMCFNVYLNILNESQLGIIFELIRQNI
ncbi:hypothetical protein Tco_1512567 [Tanacetum coccineum]